MMRRKDVKTIIAYYHGIPAMKRELVRERKDLEDEYNGLRGSAGDGMPHGQNPGKPTEELALRAEALGVWNRLEEIEVSLLVLEADRAQIQSCMDRLNGEYKKLLLMRYRDKYSWVKIGMRMSMQERTARRWHDKAVERMGEALEETPMTDELSARASRARV